MLKQIELDDILRVLRRNRSLVILVSLLGGLLMGVYSVWSVKTSYSINSTLIANLRENSAYQVQDLTLYEKMIQTYIDLGQTDLLRERMNSQLPPEVVSTVKTTRLTSKPNSQLLYITMTGSDKQALETYMNTYLEVYQGLAEANMNTFTLKVFSVERVRTHGVLPTYMFNILLGVGGGAILFMMVLVTADLLKDGLKSARELSLLFHQPLLGTIPKGDYQLQRRSEKGSKLSHEGVELLNSPFSVVSESYRMLRSHLEVAMEETGAKVLVVTSSVPGEGKSTTAVNLAVSMAQLGKHVLLVDGDFRKPAIHSYVDIDSEPGLSEILTRRGKANFQTVPVSTEFSLSVLVAGLDRQEPTELLESQRMKELVEVLRESYDLIVIDSPPLLAVTDAQIFSRYADGLLLVSDINKVKKSELVEVSHLLDTSFKNVIGLVANNIDDRYNPYYYYDY